MAEKKSMDFKTVLNSPFVNNLVTNVSKQAQTYEKRVKEVVHDLDLKSRDARQKSRKQLDRFGRQLKEARTGVESRVKTLVNKEAERLNKGFGELVTYLKSVAKSETLRATGKTSTKGKSRANGNKKTKTTKSAKSSKSQSRSRSQSYSGDQASLS